MKKGLSGNIMNKYETIIILNTKIDEKQRKSVIEKIETFVKENGEITETNDIGVKNLAYEINKCKQGYYYQMFFKAKPETISELERIYRITDEVMKFITIKM